MNVRREVIVVFALVVGSLACTLPGQEAAIEATSTPNMTMTALFAPPGNIATPTLYAPMVTLLPADGAGPLELSPTPHETQTNTPEATATTTQTPTPTSTATTAWSPCYRSGERFYANYFSSPPVIDGDWSEWSSTQYPATYVFYGADRWANSDDLSASFQLGWDNQNLYVAAKVGDERYVQNASGQDIYKGDSLEILLDANLCGDFYSTDINSGDDYQIGISPGNPDVSGNREAFLWFPQSKAGSRSVAISATQSGGLYRVEAAIPWSVFGASPFSGQTYGFSFAVSDNDDPSANWQESMVSAVVSRRLTNPTTWGTLILK
jgi:hypothetical protein